MLDDGAGPKIELLGILRSAGVVAGAPRVDGDGDRLGDADRIRNLNLGGAGDSAQDDLARYVAGEVGRGAIHLTWILAGEGAAAVPGVTAVSINDDFTSRDPAVALGTTGIKYPRRIDEGFDARMVPRTQRKGEQNAADPRPDLPLVLTAHVLRRNHHVGHRHPDLCRSQRPAQWRAIADRWHS